MKRKLVCGIDEAGRGAIIGPLVIAGVVVDEKTEKKLKRIGVKDSKLLSPLKRKELAGKIEELRKDTVVMKIPACKITSYMKDGINLNQIEAMKMAEIINFVKADVIYVDCPQNFSKKMSINKFKKYLEKFLDEKNVEMIVENYLDENVPVVSAASIIAKVERDESIEKIKRKFNFDVGNGYPSDPRALEFVKLSILEGVGSSYVRWLWNPVEEIVKRLEENGVEIQPWVWEKIERKPSFQKRLKEFLFGGKNEKRC